MPERRIATVVMLDVVGSTTIASQLGDARYRELSSRFARSVRDGLKRFAGREEDNAGDGFFVTFPEPDRAIRFATTLARDVQAFGIEIRSGIHTGQMENQDGKAQGIAVVIGARVMSLAGPGEVLVTSTTKDLATGSGFGFEDFSAHDLKGVPGTWQVFAVASVDDEVRPPPLTAEEAATRLEAIQPATGPRSRRAVLIGGGVVLVAIAAIAVVATGGDGSPRTPRGSTGPDSGSVVNVSLDGSVLASIPAQSSRPASNLGRPPDPEHPMAVGEGAVWTVRPSRLLLHVDPADQEVEKEITLPGADAFPYNVAVGFDKVWVAHLAGLAKVNPATNEYREVFRLTRDPESTLITTDIAIGDGSVWLGVSDGRLIRIDPTTGRELGTEDLGTIDAVAFGHGSVWTVDTFAGTVTRVDADSMARVDEIEIPVGVDRVIAGDHAIWALSRSNGSLTEIDIVDNVADHIVPVGEAPSGFTVGRGAVWVFDESGVIWRVDEATRQVTDIPFGAEIRALAFADDTETLWVDVA